MISDIRDFGDRRAPYAPISSLERFFERIRDRSIPEHVDHAFLRKLGVASNNEYALLSALKFLEIVDDRGRPTDAYRDLQSADAFRPALERLVRDAYGQVFALGAESWPLGDLVEFFRRTSSPSQAKNAARFFQAVCRRAGVEANAQVRLPEAAEPAPRNAANPDVHDGHRSELQTEISPVSAQRTEDDPRSALLRAKVGLLEKLPVIRPEWSAVEYMSVCDRFVELLRHLEE